MWSIRHSTYFVLSLANYRHHLFYYCPAKFIDPKIMTMENCLNSKHKANSKTNLISSSDTTGLGVIQDKNTISFFYS